MIQDDSGVIVIGVELGYFLGPTLVFPAAHSHDHQVQGSLQSTQLGFKNPDQKIPSSHGPFHTRKTILAILM